MNTTRESLKTSDLILIMVIFVVYQMYNSMYLDKTADEYYSQRILANKTNPKVYDIMHKHLPDLHDKKEWNDIYTFVVLLPLLTDTTILKKYIYIWVPIFMIRSVFTQVTILPKNKRCKIGNNVSDFLIGGCYDKVFSGHFSSVFLAMLLYVRFGWISGTTAAIGSILSALLILLVRSHYTIDILVAIVVTLLMYQNGMDNPQVRLCVN
ncbi:hypothetical protein EBU95_02060 [bacterium]|nr:hypothetical protein [bacterium]